MATLEFVRAPGSVLGGAATAVGYRADGLTPGVHRGLPSPALTFLLSIDGPVEGAWSADDVAAGRLQSGSVVLSGLHTRPAHVVQPTRQQGVQLAVDPTWSRALFGMPAGELAGGFDDAGLGAPGRRLLERVADAEGWADRFRAVGTTLRAWASSDRRGAARDDVLEAWRCLAAADGRVRIRDVARHVLLSERQLRSRFRDEFGVAPKAAARLMRFERAKARIAGSVRSGRAASLAAVAAEVGYADQAHLTHELTDFLGVSPGRWIAEERRNLQAGGHT